MKEDWWKVVEEFSSSEKSEDMVCLDLPKKYHAEYPQLPRQVTVRLLKKRSRRGEVQVFCTSLLDDKIYSRKRSLIFITNAGISKRLTNSSRHA